MTRTWRTIGVALIMLAGCSRGPAGGAERVVCVSKQINEYLYDIGAEGVLVARDLTSIYPAAITTLPSVGYHRALNAEGIISMRPTMFLNDGNLGPAAVVDQVKKVGIPVVTLLPGNSLDSAEALMDTLGALFHRKAHADSLIAEWKAGMDSLMADTAKLASGKRPRVLIIHFGQIRNNYLALKQGGPADQMLRWAGAVNAIDSVGGMAALTPELIARAAPDVIIATEVGFDRYGTVEKFKELPGVALTPAARNNRIYRITEQEIMYFGPRTPAVVRKIADLVHR
ncbi:MAG TPA: ABC transporter substrate-binding protein [Gemmatimonadales bacterium]|jgi:iron complex transport system substrate-binding protein|nr:ABC transporter substrate-binding protein [Gemmatimonadales bacterium]